MTLPAVTAPGSPDDNPHDAIMVYLATYMTTSAPATAPPALPTELINSRLVNQASQSFRGF